MSTTTLTSTIQNLTDIELKHLGRALTGWATQQITARELGFSPARVVNAVVQLLTDEHVRRRVELARLEAVASGDPARGLFLAEAVAGPLEGLRARLEHFATGTGPIVLSGPNAKYLLRLLAELKDDGGDPPTETAH
jgi:hypothetical protein